MRVIEILPFKVILTYSDTKEWCARIEQDDKHIIVSRKNKEFTFDHFLDWIEEFRSELTLEDISTEY